MLLIIYYITNYDDVLQRTMLFIGIGQKRETIDNAFDMNYFQRYRMNETGDTG